MSNKRKTPVEKAGHGFFLFLHIGNLPVDKGVI
jgi:hypothetical protein